MTKLKEYIERISQLSSQPCSAAIKADLEVVNGQILATIMDKELAHIARTYHEHHTLILQLRASKLEELLVEQQSANDEIVRGELREGQRRNEEELSRCKEKEEEAGQAGALMERRQKLLKRKMKALEAQAAEWRRRNGIGDTAVANR